VMCRVAQHLHPHPKNHPQQFVGPWHLRLLHA
jgi:hypothetical protein